MNLNQKSPITVITLHVLQSGPLTEIFLTVRKTPLLPCCWKKVFDLLKVSINVENDTRVYSLLNVYSRLKSLLLENQRHWIKYEELYVSGGPLRPICTPFSESQLAPVEDLYNNHWLAWNFDWGREEAKAFFGYIIMMASLRRWN